MKELCTTSVWVMLTIMTLQKPTTGVNVFILLLNPDSVHEIINVPQNLLKVCMNIFQHVDNLICTQRVRLGKDNVSCRQLKLLLGNIHILEECVSGVSSDNGSANWITERLTWRLAYSMPRTSFHQWMLSISLHRILQLLCSGVKRLRTR